jgi:DNA-binding transcriptional ArsR family regulator
VIAMPAGTKKPIEENWGNKPTTRLPEGYKNLGMIHGWNKTVCIDLDNLEQSIVAFESLGIDIQQLCSHAPAWHGNPHNRIKYLFKIPEGASIRREVLNVHGRTVFELRGDTNGKQLQDVIPPSVHPDGYSYQWVNPLVPLAELPELPSELLKVWDEFDGIEAGLMAILGDYSKEIANYERMGGGNTSDKTRALIAEYNNRHPVTELLERAGYKPPKRGQTKWLCPTSESGTPGVWISDDERLCYSHHGSDVLGDGKAHDAFDVLRICLHDGSFDEAKQEAFEEIGDVGDEVPVITPDELAQGQKPAANDEPSNLSRNGHEPPKNGYDGLAKRLPGFLKRIYDYYEDTAYKPYPPFGIATALSAMSTLTQNHYFVDGYNLGINLYHILVAHTGFGKEGPRAAIKNLLHECELSGVIAESIASGPAIKKRLSKDRTLMLMADEIGSMLASTVGKNADQHQTGVLKELRTLYSSATTVIGGHHYADSSKDIPPIAYPFVNLLGTSTPLQLMDGISLNQIENGLINRLIMIEAVGDPDRRERRRPIKPPEDLVHDLKEFIMRRHNYPQEIQVTSEADQLIRASELYQDDLLKQDSELSGLYGRLNENTIRVAAVLAVAEVPEKPIMTAQHVEWAKQYVYSAAQAMEKSFSDNFYESEIDKQIKKVIKTIRTYKDSIWVPKSHISRETRLSKRHLDEHLSTLMDRELIEERKEAANDKKAGRPTRYFRMLDAG